MKELKKKDWFIKLRFLPLFLCVVFIVLYFIFGTDISPQTILEYTPSNPWLAAAFLMLLYAVKSLSVFFPIIVLQIAAGFLFPPITAIFINILGTVIDLTIPYWLGKITGSTSVDRLSVKYPKLVNMIEHQQNNRFFLSFFLRVISCLPGDAVSIYLGAIGIPFVPCLFGSLLGTLPGIITATLIGASITQPSSPMFWISICLTVALSILSFIVYVLWRRKKQRKTKG